MWIKKFLVCKLLGHRPMRLIKYIYYNEVIGKDVGLFECIGCGKRFKAFSIWPFLREETYSQKGVTNED